MYLRVFSYGNYSESGYFWVAKNSNIFWVLDIPDISWGKTVDTGPKPTYEEK